MSDLFSYLHLDGPEYAYLGHFRSMEFICAGHNDVSGENDAEAVDEAAQTLGGGRLENAASTTPQGA